MTLTTTLAGAAFLLAVGVQPVLAADKSVTPDGKPAPSQPAAKPGSKAAAADDAARMTYERLREVYSGNTTIAGEKVRFPAENQAVHAVVVTMQPGEETGWHQHHAPMFAYILKGELTVTYEGLGKKVYRVGEGLLEAMNVTHQGRNTGETPAEVLAVFLLGDAGVPTVPEDAPGADKNKVE